MANSANVSLGMDIGFSFDKNELKLLANQITVVDDKFTGTSESIQKARDILAKGFEINTSDLKSTINTLSAIKELSESLKNMNIGDSFEIKVGNDTITSLKSLDNMISTLSEKAKISNDEVKSLGLNLEDALMKISDNSLKKAVNSVGSSIKAKLKETIKNGIEKAGEVKAVAKLALDYEIVESSFDKGSKQFKAVTSDEVGLGINVGNLLSTVKMSDEDKKKIQEAMKEFASNEKVILNEQDKVAKQIKESFSKMFASADDLILKDNSIRETTQKLKNLTEEINKLYETSNSSSSKEKLLSSAKKWLSEYSKIESIGSKELSKILGYKTERDLKDDIEVYKELESESILRNFKRNIDYSPLDSEIYTDKEGKVDIEGQIEDIQGYYDELQKVISLKEQYSPELYEKILSNAGVSNEEVEGEFQKLYDFIIKNEDALSALNETAESFTEKINKINPSIASQVSSVSVKNEESKEATAKQSEADALREENVAKQNEIDALKAQNAETESQKSVQSESQIRAETEAYNEQKAAVQEVAARLSAVNAEKEKIDGTAVESSENGTVGFERNLGLNSENISDYTTEIASVDALKAKITELTAEINAKTLAIEEETNRMVSGSQAEVQAVENITSAVTKLKEAVATDIDIKLGISNIEEVKAEINNIGMTAPSNDSDSFKLLIIPQINETASNSLLTIRSQIQSALSNIPITVSLASEDITDLKTQIQDTVQQIDVAKASTDKEKSSQTSQKWISRLESKKANKANALGERDIQINRLNGIYKDAIERVNELKDSNGDLSNEALAEIKNLEKQAEELYSKMSKLSGAKFESQIQSLENNADRRKDFNSIIEITDLKNRVTNLFDEDDSLDSKKFKEELNDVYKEFDRLIDKQKQLKTTANQEIVTTKVEGKFNDLIVKMKQYLELNSKMKKDSPAMSNFNSILESAESMPRSEQNFQSLVKQFNNLKNEVTSKGLTGRSLGDELSYITEKIGLKAIIGNQVYRMLDYFKQMISVVTELDTSMTDLKRVSEETDAVYDKFLNSSADKAQELGSTMKDVVDATTAFARLGYNIDEASSLAKSALIYRNVGEVDIDTATSDIISALKAFNIEASESSRVVDVFNKIGNEFAVTSADIGTGLNESASAMAVAGNSFEESAAMITAITEITQDASSAGNALKTLGLRIRGAKSDLEAAGLETDGMIESTASLRQQIKSLSGVEIMSDDSTFKSTYQIMKEIAAQWDSMTDINQASLLDILAGKTRANQVSALLSNFSQAESALETALNSAGTAAEENAIYLDSIEGRIAQLKATAQGLSNDIIDSDLIKFIVSFGNGALKIINGIMTSSEKIVGVTDSVTGISDEFDKWKSIPSIIGAISAALSVMGKKVGMKMPLVSATEPKHKPKNCWETLTLVYRNAA